MKFLVTGGAGFIGGTFIRYLIKNTSHKVFNIDKLTYASNSESLTSIKKSKRYYEMKVDICDQKIKQIFISFKPDIIIHFAAESHVDRSIEGPSVFIKTNIFGTFNLLEQAKYYYSLLKSNKKKNFRFLHVSTDEVYGELNNLTDLFSEKTPYNPSSPYSASKASSDHLVRAWHKTFKLPILITNCSNNYGPYQFPEKLIPHMIISALKGNKLPVYGNGRQIRDWLHVEDHVRGILKVIKKGKIGETYNIGGSNEKKNIEVVKLICRLLDRHVTKKPNNIKTFNDLIVFVRDRPGHDKRYAINSQKIQKKLFWKPKKTFTQGLKSTVLWYLNNKIWWEKILMKQYKLKRMGLLK